MTLTTEKRSQYLDPSVWFSQQ